MSEWKEYKLGECVTVLNGYAFKSSDFKNTQLKDFLPVIKIKNVANGDVTLNDVQYHHYSEEYNNYVLSKGDILIALTGNHSEAKTQVVGGVSLYKLNKKALLNQRVAKIIPHTNIVNEKYLYYLMKEDNFHMNIASKASGSASQANISKKDIEEMVILLPSLTKQDEIASILSSLDDKIDLLNRENATLEAMAETLFRQWFIEEAKEDWEVGKLGDLIEVKYGKDHKKLNDGNIPVFGSGGVMRYADTALYDKESVLIPRKGSLNNVMYINEPFWTVDTMFYTEMRRPNIAKFIYHFIKRQDLANMNVGSAVPSMTTEVLNNIPLDIPSQGLFDKYEESVSALYSKQQQNRTQIKTLTEQRDRLLPILMSNEIQL